MTYEKEGVVEDRETKAAAEKGGTEAEQETVASEMVMEAGEMSAGWSLEWVPTALGELRVRGRRPGEDKAGAKRSR